MSSYAFMTWCSIKEGLHILIAWYFDKERDNFALPVVHVPCGLLDFTTPTILREMIMVVVVVVVVSSSNEKSRDSSVVIALGYGLEDWGSRVRFPAGAGNFCLHHRVQNGSGAHPASYPVGTRGSFPGDKAPGA
jgi:hypothetical protein